jgi:tetratricopeptide (TPR) repeat protein
MTGAEIVAWVGPKLGAYAFSKTLDTLLKICLEQQVNYEKILNYHGKALEQVRANVELLSASYYRAGFDHLEDASRARKAALRDELILEAVKKFTQAAHVNPQPLPQVRAQEAVGVCYLLLQEKPLAKHWFEKAYQTAEAATPELVEAVNSAFWPDMGKFEYQRQSDYEESAPELEAFYAHMRPLSRILSSMSSGIKLTPAKSLKVPEFVEDPPPSSTSTGSRWAEMSNSDIRDAILDAWWR